MGKLQLVYTNVFREKIVALYHSGKSMSYLSRVYGPSISTISRWIRFSGQSGSFREEDNRIDQEKELIALRKRNLELEMENDILKQAAALILGRK